MDTIELLAHFLERGYVVLPGALDGDSVDRFWDEVETQIEHNPELTFAMYGQLLKNRDVQGRVMQNREVLRIIDLEDHVQRARDLMLFPPVTGFLSAYYDEVPTAIQTLTYKYSSQQGAPSDLQRTRKSFVVHYARMPESMSSPSPGNVKQRHLGGWLYANAGG